MTYTIHTIGTSVNGHGKWSYHAEYVDQDSGISFSHSDSGESEGTTQRQMKLMAILQALHYVKSSDPSATVILRSDCEWCVKCITGEYDCMNDNKFRKDKVTRGYVQYLQEIRWKAQGLSVQYLVV